MKQSDFDEWLDKQIPGTVPLVAWGPSHTKIALMFARDMARASTREVLDYALNSGDGSYKP